jgi:hypothetical protein
LVYSIAAHPKALLPHRIAPVSPRSQLYKCICCAFRADRMMLLVARAR